MELADGRGVHTRLFSLDVSRADDVDSDAVAAMRVPQMHRRSSVSLHPGDIFDWLARSTHGAHSAAKFLAKLETAALDEL